MDKKTLRQIKRKQRSVFPAVLKYDYGQRIFERLKPYLDQAQRISTYISVVDEVDTLKAIDYCLNHHKQMSAPVVEDDRLLMKSFYNLRDCAVVNGLLEPVDGVVQTQFDLIVVPLLAFNDKGYRIGYGKGYYDRFLQSENGLKIGLAFEFMLEDFQQDEFDVPLDIILTEENVYLFNEA